MSNSVDSIQQRCLHVFIHARVSEIFYTAAQEMPPELGPGRRRESAQLGSTNCYSSILPIKAGGVLNHKISVLSTSEQRKVALPAIWIARMAIKDAWRMD